jgi:citrate lyase beta subunit
LRGLLFCPGNNDRRMHKAMAAGADAVILDLGDSVHPDVEDEARPLVARILTGGDWTVPVVVRLNANDTDWHLPDLAAILTPAAAAEIARRWRTWTMSDSSRPHRGHRRQDRPPDSQPRSRDRQAAASRRHKPCLPARPRSR